MKQTLVIFIILLSAFCASATVLNVPSQYPTIQGAINAASYGDTIQVAPGTYYENVMLTSSSADNLKLFGSGWENTIIDGSGLTNVIYVYQVPSIHIEGFTVRNAQQSGSAPGCVGIHLNPIGSTGTKIVRNCHVTHNGHGIQVWNDFGAVTYVENNIIDDNLYDGFYPYLGTTYLTNNTIVNNGRDGYNDWSGGGQVYIKNNIIANNARYGIYKHLNTPVYISYNDVYNNAQGAYMQGYSGPAQPFIPNPGTGEIAEDPLFFGAPFDYYLSWANFPTVDPTMSPCIDAGDPTLPNDPDGTVADMGFHYFDQTYNDVDVTLTPINPPIIIPAGGGSFDYNALLQNNEAFAVNMDVWLLAQLPDGSLYGPLLGPTNIMMGASGVVDRDRTQFVPGAAPAGNYQLIGYAGVYPTTIWNSSSFDWSKSGSDANDPYVQWFNTGEEFEPAGDAILATASDFDLIEAYPNPFNPTTTISIQLSVFSHVNLSVYDVSGRTVETLVDGYLTGGQHQFQFNGSRSSSGIYFVELNSEKGRNMKKITLLK